MRIIDIYREDSGSGLRLVAGDLIQTGENTVVQSRNAKVHIMADGSLSMYPSDKDKNQITISLECSRSQADAVADAGHCGKLYFAGLHAGTKVSPTRTDRNYAESAKTAFACYLTGNTRIQQIAGDLYAVDLTVQIDFSETQIIPG